MLRTPLKAILPINLNIGYVPLVFINLLYSRSYNSRNINNRNDVERK